VDCQTLYIPPLLTGPDYDLTLAESSVEWSEGVATQTYAYNGQPFWGPTLRMHKGDDVRMNVTNELMDETTAHWHGFHIPAAMDGGPHQPIASGSTWSPEFTVMNDAGMYWYHPHMHMMTAMQLAMGAGGLICAGLAAHLRRGRRAAGVDQPSPRRRRRDRRHRDLWRRDGDQRHDER
jgi:bilirubin oxidase